MAEVPGETGQGSAVRMEKRGRLLRWAVENSGLDVAPQRRVSTANPATCKHGLCQKKGVFRYTEVKDLEMK